MKKNLNFTVFTLFKEQICGGAEKEKPDERNMFSEKRIMFSSELDLCAKFQNNRTSLSGSFRRFTI
jgi:hypothetical protein